MEQREQWEHLTVETTYNESDRTRQLWTLGAPIYVKQDIEIQQGQGDPVARLLDDLGREGWQLVAVDPQGGRDVYWLKRRAQ